MSDDYVSPRVRRCCPDCGWIGETTLVHCYRRRDHKDGAGTNNEKFKRNKVEVKNMESTQLTASVWIGIVALFLVLVAFIYAILILPPRIIRDREEYEEVKIRNIIRKEFKRNKVK